MLQEKDLNILNEDLQPQHHQGVRVQGMDEDQEEFDKLKEVLPTLSHTNSSQVSYE